VRRFKILIGTSCLVFAVLVIATASKSVNSNSEPTVSILSPEQIEESKLYNLRQQELKKALDAYFQKAIQVGHIVGAGVSIVKGDSILISDGFGKRSYNKKAKVNGETIFRLGSLSKGFAAVLAADLKSEGKIDWNDKVVDYIPEFQFGNTSNTQKVRLSHVLSHTSGTPYHSFTNLVEAGLPMEAIAKRFAEVKPISEPGLQYSYQNAMFSLSQEVMQKATGKDTKTLLSERFFKPLDMTTVSMNHESLIAQENVALPHGKRRSGWRSIPLRNRYYNAVAAGGINASSLDMAKWMRFLLGHNAEVMNKSELQDVFTPFISFKNRRKYYQRWPGHLKSSYGFGWRIHQFQESPTAKEYTVWHHGGSVNNYRNEIAIYPESDLGICVLLSNNSKIARTVIPDLHQLVKTVFLDKQVDTPSQSIVDVQFDKD
jgi:beta-lactamase class C